MILVVWTTEHDLRDHWAAYETMQEAQEQYRELLKRDDVYSASLCAVLESTDYKQSGRLL